jgi:hypothetical protein
MTEPILMPFQDLPFNGDTFVQAEFLKLKEKFNIDRVIETGSCLYSTTKWLGENFESVKTIEINEDYSKYGIHKVKDMPNVTAIVGISSVEWLNQVASVYESNPYIIHNFLHLFFLDAHWGDDCPLLQELEAISKLRTTQKPVIVIHDFKVPNEPTLGYDSIHSQAFEFDWIKPKLEMIYGVDGYDYYYNTDATATEIKRGLIYITPKI